jgi:hypothetical protein
MGLFDYVTCAYPLPVADVAGRVWQTKDTGCPSMDRYEIRADGTLWHEDYDVEDRSDPTAEGIMRVAGMMSRVNKRWEQVPEFTGEIRFYSPKHEDGSNGGFGRGWLEFSAYFVNGQLAQLHCVCDEDGPRGVRDGR